MKTLLKITMIALLAAALQTRPARAQDDTFFKLKHVSVFTQASAHNPFWPIGWVKGADVSRPAEQQEVSVPISSANFVVTSISISSTPLANINNRSCAEGETITASFAGQTMKILVKAIHDGDVVLEYQGKDYTVPLKRNELSPKEHVSEPVTSQQGPMMLR